MIIVPRTQDKFQAFKFNIESPELRLPDSETLLTVIQYASAEVARAPFNYASSTSLDAYVKGS